MKMPRFMQLTEVSLETLLIMMAILFVLARFWFRDTIDNIKNAASKDDMEQIKTELHHVKTDFHGRIDRIQEEIKTHTERNHVQYEKMLEKISEVKK